jgi:hypothetical protein
VECHPWATPHGSPRKNDAECPDGVDAYSCSWDPITEWDVQPYQNIGVSYREPDGNALYNEFY